MELRKRRVLKPETGTRRLQVTHRRTDTVENPRDGWRLLSGCRRGKEPSAPAKFGLALVQMGLANLVLVWGAQAFGLAAMTPVIFVFLYYLLATTGELCLSPVGLSAMNRLAPKFMASLIMGAWFYMTAVGNFVAGKL